MAYSSCPPALPLVLRLPKGFPPWVLGDRGSQSPPFTWSLLFSISLLGKPPHSSIMSMATGKNLLSIPKKVSEAEPASLGLSQGIECGGG